MTEDVPFSPEQNDAQRQKVVAEQKTHRTDTTSSSKDQPKPAPENEYEKAQSSDTAVASTSGSGAGADADVVSMEIDDEECIRDEQVNRYLYEPMLVQDSSSTVVPQCLEAVYCDKLPCDSHDAVARVLHVLMNETGFRSLSDKAARQV